jgi:uncharacterized small protein (DUF1192 family)
MAGPPTPQQAFDAARQRVVQLQADIEQLKADIQAAAGSAQAANSMMTNIPAPPPVPPPPTPPPPKVLPPGYSSNANAVQAKAAVLAGKAAAAALAEIDAKILLMETEVANMDAARAAHEAQQMAAATGLLGRAGTIISTAWNRLPSIAPGALAVCTKVAKPTMQSALAAVAKAKEDRGTAALQQALAKAEMDSAVNKRVIHLELEGHGPQRHLKPTPLDLIKRALYKVDPETGEQREFKNHPAPAGWKKHVANATASVVKKAEDYVLAEAVCREAFLNAICPPVPPGSPPGTLPVPPVPLPGSINVPILIPPQPPPIPGAPPLPPLPPGAGVFNSLPGTENSFVSGVTDTMPAPASAVRNWAQTDTAPGNNSPGQVRPIPTLPGAPVYPVAVNPTPPPPVVPHPGAGGAPVVPAAALHDNATILANAAANTVAANFAGGTFFAAYKLNGAAPCSADPTLTTMYPSL